MTQIVNFDQGFKMVDATSSSSWSWEEEKAFENALAIHFQDTNDGWEKIAQELPEKSIEEIKQHYVLLLEDIDAIDSGKVPLPNYLSSSEDIEGDGGKKSRCSNHEDSSHGGKSSKSELERRKGIAWSEEEHRLFLLGLEKYGKGDWRSISRNFVVSRTPTQVASHAQKYFIRLNSMNNKERRRTSIHDITSPGNNQDVVAPNAAVAGQANTSRAPLNNNNGKPCKQSTQASLGTAVGQPVGSTPAVGTPVNLPGPLGTVVTGAPVNMSYHMPRTSSHR